MTDSVDAEKTPRAAISIRDLIAAKKAALPQPKKFSELTEEEKNELLKTAAVRLGLIAKE
jgi:hypothetical protein